MGFEPMHIGTTIRGLNRLTTPAITVLIFSTQEFKNHLPCLKYHLKITFCQYYAREKTSTPTSVMTFSWKYAHAPIIAALSVQYFIAGI